MYKIDFDKNSFNIFLLLEEFFYFFALVLPVGVYINFSHTILSNFSKFDSFYKLFFSSVVFILLLICFVGLIKITTKLKQYKKEYNEYKNLYYNNFLQYYLSNINIITIILFFYYSFLVAALYALDSDNLATGINCFYCALFVLLNISLYYLPFLINIKSKKEISSQMSGKFEDIF